MRRAFVAVTSLVMAACAAAPVSRVGPLAYVDGGEPRQSGELFLPEGPGSRPAVVVVHGGGWTGGERADMEKFARRLARAGYAVLNVEYRLAPAHRFPAQLEDLQHAVAWLRANGARWRIDAARIGVLGYSAGAHLAMLLGTSGAGIRAVVAGAGPADLTVYPDSPYCKALLGGTPDVLRAEYERASPLFHVSPASAPTFMYHGRFDTLVEVEQSRRMHARLMAAGVPSQLHEMPLSGHVTAYLFDGDAFDAALAFLDRHLR